jgi:phosphoribosylaminoimidazole-succinocarboxamide synthase
VAALNDAAELYDRVSHIAPELYRAAAEHAAMRGLVINDTRFEFGPLVGHGELIVNDNALAPDSSRYWLLERYCMLPVVAELRQAISARLAHVAILSKSFEGGPDEPGWSMTEEVVQDMRERYLNARVRY